MKKLFSTLVILLISLSVSAYLIQGRRDGGGSGTDYLLDADIAAAWYMNANTGSETDRTGNGNTLADYATVPTDSEVPDHVGQVYSGTSRLFNDEDSDRLYRTDTDDSDEIDIFGDPCEISFGGWWQSNDKDTDQVIIAKGSTGTDRQYYLRYDIGDDEFYCGLATDSSTFVVAITDCTSAFSQDTWYHVVCVYDDTDITIYINGSTSGCTGTNNPKTYSSGIYDGDGDFKVGSFGGSGHMDGYIDEPFVFSRDLLAAEVAEIYEYGIDGDRGGND